MKKAIAGLLAALLLLLAASCACANTVADTFCCGLAYFEVNGKYGYVDTRGKIVIPAQWDYAGKFCESGYAVVFIGTTRESGYPEKGSYGIINTKGEYLLEPTECHDIDLYTVDRLGFYSISYKVGESDWDFAFVSLDGKLLGGKIWSNAYSSSLPMAVEDENGKWGYVDFEHGMLIPCRYEKAHQFYNGLALVETTNAKGRTAYEYIDLEGNTVITGTWDYAESFSDDGYARVFRGTLSKYGSPEEGKYAYINRQGEYITDYVFDEARDFRGGLAAVATVNAKGRKVWGLINPSGEYVVPAEWDYAYSPVNGYAQVFRGTLSKYGSPDEGIWGYVDLNGNLIAEPQWVKAQDFGEDGKAIAAVADGDGRPLYGIIGTDGSPVIPYAWESIGAFSEGRAAVKQDGKYGYIDETGALVIPAKWEKAGKFSGGVAIVWDSETWYIIDSEGNAVF